MTDDHDGQRAVPDEILEALFDRLEGPALEEVLARHQGWRGWLERERRFDELAGQAARDADALEAVTLGAGEQEALVATVRAARQAEAQLAEVIAFPGWVQADGSVALAAAASAEERREGGEQGVRLGDYPGGVELTLRPEYDGQGPGRLVLTWSADLYHEPGWRLHLYRPGDSRPSATMALGDAKDGEVVLDAEALGFDPVREPFGYVFEAISP